MSHKKRHWLWVLLLLLALISTWIWVVHDRESSRHPLDTKQDAPPAKREPMWSDHPLGQTAGPEYVPLKQMLVPVVEQNQGYWLTGKVTNDKGKPLQGAKVSLLPWDLRNRLGGLVFVSSRAGLPTENIHSSLGRIAMNSSADKWEWPKPQASATSDADGRYQIESETPIHNWVTVEKEGYATIEDTLVQGGENRRKKLSHVVSSGVH
jgi:hypothetical protein